MKGGTSRDGALLFRAGVGGALMGLANLVPGVSGGTMLLAAGVYPALIRALAELTRLRLSWRPVLLAGTVAAAGALAIGLFAGWIRELVIGQRWVMYSLFIGLTLGGVSLIWRLSRPASPSFWIGAALGFALLLPMALGPPTGSAGEGGAIGLMLAGVAGAAAMILPGISGAYLLLLLGQYEAVLGAVERLKQVLLSGGADAALLTEALSVLIPVAAGGLLGLAAGTRAIGWLLERHAKPTHGVLLGLLLGAVLGLWPFQAGVRPQAGEIVAGRVLTQAEAASLEPAQWPVRRFAPTAGHWGWALGLAATGLLATTLLGRLDRNPESKL